MTRPARSSVLLLMVILLTTLLAAEASSTTTLKLYPLLGGITFSTVRLHQSMQVHKVLWEEGTASAAALELAADEEVEQSAATQVKAQNDIAQGEAMQQEAAAVQEKADKDLLVAEAEGVTAQDLAAEATAEETEMTADLAAAAAEEATMDADLAESALEAEAAAMNSAEAHADETGVLLCEWIPGADIVCNVLGGLTSVALESAAAEETALSIGEFAAAAAATSEEEAQLTAATGLQAKAAGDAEAASNTDASAVELREKAEAEQAAAEDEEAVAQGKMELGAAEEEAATEEEAEAVSEQEEAEKISSQALRHGLSAFTLAVWGAVVSVAGLVLGGLGVLFRHVMPSAATPTADSRSDLSIPTSAESRRCIGWYNMSYWYHHAMIFLLVSGVFGDSLALMNNMNVQSRGGTILLFSVVAACAQTLLLHIPVAMVHGRSNEQRWNAVTSILLSTNAWFLLSLVLLEGLTTLVALERLGVTTTCTHLAFMPQWLIAGLVFATAGTHWFLSLLAVCEAMIVHLTVGQTQLFVTFVECFQHWPLRVFVLVTIIIHHWQSHGRPLALHASMFVDETAPLTSDQSDVNYTPSDDQVLPEHHVITEQTAARYKDLQKLQLPAELLVVAVLLACTRQFLPVLKTVWTVAKPSVYEHLQVKMLCLVGGFMLVIMSGCIVVRMRRGTAGASR